MYFSQDNFHSKLILRGLSNKMQVYQKDHVNLMCIISGFSKSLPEKCYRKMLTLKKFFVLHLIVIDMNLLCAKFHISSCLQSKVIIWTYFFPNSPKTRAWLWHHQQPAFLFLDFYFNGSLQYGSFLCKKSVLIKF